MTRYEAKIPQYEAYEWTGTNENDLLAMCEPLAPLPLTMNVFRDEDNNPVRLVINDNMSYFGLYLNVGEFLMFGPIYNGGATTKPQVITPENLALQFFVVEED